MVRSSSLCFVTDYVLLIVRPLEQLPTRWPLVLLAAVLVGALAGCSPSEESGPADRSPDPAAAQERISEARSRLTQNPGGELVLRAIDAHGGLDAWYRAPTSSYTWEYANEDADLQFKSFLVADNRTRQVYHDLLSVGSYQNPRPVDARFAWDGGQVWVHPPSIDRPNPRFWALSGYYFEQIPFVLADPGLNYEALPSDTLNGELFDMVRVSFEPGVGESSGDTYTLYIDRETDRVAAIRYTVTYGQDPSEVGSPHETLFYYEDYVTVDDLTVATHFRGYQFENGGRGAFKNEAWADSISFQRPFDPSKLEPPQGARFVPPPTTNAD